MTILEFIEKCEKMTSEKAIEKMMEQHVVRTYCPVAEKRYVLQEMLNSAVVSDENTGMEFIDMFLSRINYTLALIVLYTDLKVDADEDGTGLTFEDYDAVVSYGLVEIVCKKIGEREIKELSDINGCLMSNFEKSTSTISLILKAIGGLNLMNDTVSELMKNEGLLSLLENSNG